MLTFVPDKDLCGRNVVLLQSTVLREMLNISTDIGAAGMIHYHIMSIRFYSVHLIVPMGS